MDVIETHELRAPGFIDGLWADPPEPESGSPLSREPALGFDHHRLDEVYTSRLRLAIASALFHAGTLEFSALKRQVDATDGNMSTHTRRMEEAGYIEVDKRFVDRKPSTRYRLTEMGLAAFIDYVGELDRFLGR